MLEKGRVHTVKKRLIIFVTFLMLFALLPAPLVAADDLKGHVLETEMRAVVELGIMKGYREGVFGPNDSITRAQFATFVARALNLPSPPPTQENFNDVPRGVGLADGIYRAAAAGIVSGYPGNEFKPDQRITREQMAVMIDRALGYKSINRTPVFLAFTDLEQIAPMFRQAVSHNVYFGIIRGNPVGNGLYRFAPKEDATRAHAAAFIHRMLFVINNNGQQIVNYQIGTITNGKLNLAPTQYLSYADALRNMTNLDTQVITLGQQIVKMKDGIVVAAPTPGNATVQIYEETMRTNLTYVVPGTELKYLDSDDKKIKVQIADADTVGFIKSTEAMLIPTPLITNRTYYEVVNGELRHVIFNHLRRTTGSYMFGPAPKQMSNGETYISWNGIDFVGINNNKTISYTQYFNYLPLHTKSNYTAEELNAYVAHVRPQSPLRNLGHVFIEAQELYGVNALYLFAKAIHESDFAMSKIAVEKNNLFGLNATDSDPEGNADTFESMEGCIMHAARFLSTTYFSFGTWRYNGVVLGNKSKGLNVRYASDPYWGQKIAGHMNRIDRFHNRKDYNKYAIGLTTSASLNVRHQPVVSPSTVQFTYPRAGYYVAILEETAQPDGTWFKIISDHGSFKEAYVHSNFVRRLSFE